MEGLIKVKNKIKKEGEKSSKLYKFNSFISLLLLLFVIFIPLILSIDRKIVILLCVIGIVLDILNDTYI